MSLLEILPLKTPTVQVLAKITNQNTAVVRTATVVPRLGG